MVLGFETLNSKVSRIESMRTDRTADLLHPDAFFPRWELPGAEFPVGVPLLLGISTSYITGFQTG